MAMNNVSKLPGVRLGDDEGAEAFREMFRKINQYYRRGHFEIRIDPSTGDEVLSKDEKWPEALKLAEAAQALSEIAIECWQRKQVPAQHYQTVLRSIVNAYELQDYFLQVPENLRLFLDDFSDSLLARAAADLGETVREIAGMHSHDFHAEQTEHDCILLANEFLLLVMCSINSLYRNHSPKAYEVGLQKLEQLKSLLEKLNAKKGHKSLALVGLQQYLLGRMYFGVGDFADAEVAFKASADSYLERIKARIHSAPGESEQSADEIEEARLLSLRRATLARCLGTAYLYVVQGKLREAIELLDTGVPLLALDCGRIIFAYCELIGASASRALNSDKDEILEKCEERINECLAVFKIHVAESHYPRRAILELELVKHFRSRLLFKAARHSSTSEKERIKQSLAQRYSESLDQLNNVKAFACAGGDAGRKNPRLLLEALILSAQFRRTHLKMMMEMGPYNPTEAMRIIEECIAEARYAVRHSESMKQQHCEALMALGQALQYQQTIIRSQDYNSAKSNTDWRESARAEYLNALRANRDENPRITAQVFLLLAELEMEDQGNYFKARKYFEKYREISGSVQHRFCLDKANSLKRALDRPNSDFSIDVDSQTSLDLKKQQSKLRDFLIQQAIYRIARQNADQLPQKDKKSDARPDDNDERPRVNSADKLRRDTKLSVLANGFMKELGLPRKAAYDLATKQLPEFKKWASPENKLR